MHQDIDLSGNWLDDAAAAGFDPTAAVLVVDHDVDLRRDLSGYLLRYGFDVLGASNAQEAHRRLRDAAVDLLVLGASTTMPGIALCRELGQGRSLPTIVLSDDADQMERILALEQGADDLMERPCHPRELLARIRALLRRAQVVPVRDIRDAWMLSARKRVVVTPQGNSIPLTPAEHMLLDALAQAPDGFLDSDQAGSLFNEGALDPANNLRTAMARLRRKLGDIDGTLIRTAFGRGYYTTVRLVQV